MKIQKVGFPWYERENYERLKEIFTDGDNLPATYEDWLRKAEEALAKLQRDGHVVVKANIDPDSFPEWCRAQGWKVDSTGRRRFATEFAARDDVE